MSAGRSIRVSAWIDEGDEPMFDRIYFGAVPADLGEQVVERGAEAGSDLGLAEPVRVDIYEDDPA